MAETLGPMEPPPDVPPLPDLGPMDLPYQRGGTYEVEQTEEGVKLKERVEAKVGVGKKGRRLEDPKMVKMIVTPAVDVCFGSRSESPLKCGTAQDHADIRSD